MHRIPIRTYFFLAILTVATMGLSNASVPYLNYPTQVMFKSCKLIPVLIGGILIQGMLLVVDFLENIFKSRFIFKEKDTKIYKIKYSSFFTVIPSIPFIFILNINFSIF